MQSDTDSDFFDSVKIRMRKFRVIFSLPSRTALTLFVDYITVQLHTPRVLKGSGFCWSVSPVVTDVLITFDVKAENYWSPIIA